MKLLRYEIRHASLLHAGGAQIRVGGQVGVVYKRGRGGYIVFIALDYIVLPLYLFYKILKNLWNIIRNVQKQNIKF